MRTYQVLQGDSLASLKLLPSNSVHTCVTSPPYYGLRDYGMDGQIGLEETPEAFVDRLVHVFREVRRVLRDDGTLWVNIADTYVQTKKIRGLKTKDLIGIPWMLAFALRADGWCLRQDIIWHKPNPMPEGVLDRCTKSHEYIFLLTKSDKYYYDNSAIREPWKNSPYDIKRATEKHPGYEGKHKDGYNGQIKGQPVGDPSKGRNKRSVWSIPTKSYKGAHFATYPPDLIKPCILAGCQVGGVVLDPFAGSGTTAEVALLEDRNAILCELNPEYIGIINARLSKLETPLKLGI